MLKTHAAASVALVSALAGSACSIDVHGNGVVVTEERRFPAGEGVELVLRTFDGAIDVQSWDRDEVAVRIERKAATGREAEVLEVRATHEGNRVVLEAREPRGDADVLIFGPGRSVSFIVRTPRRLDLDARAGDGAIRAIGLEGAITLNTGDGSVRAERVEGEVRVRTGDGSITIGDAGGVLDVSSGDGSIDLSARLDSLRVHTGDGSVHVDAAEGSIMQTDWSVTTGDGRISVRLPVGLNADVEADSGDGRVSADWVGERPRREDDDRQSFRGRLGTGGPILRLRSGDGSIDISRR